MGQRRTKVEVLNEKISKVDSKIAAYTEKIAALEDEKTALAAQLEEIHKAAKKAEEAAELKRLLNRFFIYNLFILYLFMIRSEYFCSPYILWNSFPSGLPPLQMKRTSPH